MLSAPVTEPLAAGARGSGGLRLRRLLLAAGALVLLAVLAFLLYVWKLGRVISIRVHPPRTAVTASQLEEARRTLPGLRDVDLQTKDGVRLSAWYAPGSNGAAVFYVHGVASNRAAFLKEAETLAARGYGLLLFDLRAHGDSGGDLCTWGDRERDDVAAAVDYLASRPEVRRIGAVGMSIGAYAVAIEAAGDDRLRALVLEGATPTFREGEASDESWLEYTVSIALYKWHGLRVDDIDTVASLRRMAPRPVFVVVGSKDPYITRPMTDEVVAAAPGPKTLYVVRDAEHGDYVRAAGDEYLRRVASFFDEALR